jgi:hypothetical protein
LAIHFLRVFPTVHRRGRLITREDKEDRTEPFLWVMKEERLEVFEMVKGNVKRKEKEK